MEKRKYVRIKEQDNVVVVVQDTAAGTEIMEGPAAKLSGMGWF